MIITYSFLHLLFVYYRFDYMLEDFVVILLTQSIRLACVKCGYFSPSLSLSQNLFECNKTENRQYTLSFARINLNFAFEQRTPKSILSLLLIECKFEYSLSILKQHSFSLRQDTRPQIIGK